MGPLFPCFFFFFFRCFFLHVFFHFFIFFLQKPFFFLFLLLLSGGGSWSFLLEVGVSPSQLGLALPSQGWGWSFLFAPFFSLHLSMFLESLTQAGQSAPHQRKDEGIQHNPKGNEGVGQDLAKRGGGEGHQRKGWGRPGPEPKKGEEGEVRPGHKGKGSQARPKADLKEGKIGVSRAPPYRENGPAKMGMGGPGPFQEGKEGEGQARPKREGGEGQAQKRERGRPRPRRKRKGWGRPDPAKKGKG